MKIFLSIILIFSSINLSAGRFEDALENYGDLLGDSTEITEYSCKSDADGDMQLKFNTSVGKVKMGIHWSKYQSSDAYHFWTTAPDTNGWIRAVLFEKKTGKLSAEILTIWKQMPDDGFPQINFQCSRIDANAKNTGQSSIGDKQLQIVATDGIKTNYLMINQIVEAKGYRYFWRFSDFPTEPINGYKSNETLHEADCTNFRLRTMMSTYYKKPMLMGEKMDLPHIEDYDKWIYPEENTLLGLTLRKACSAPINKERSKTILQSL